MLKPVSVTEETVSETNLNRRNMGAIAGVLLSRLLGVARTVIVNATFGANVALDAFNTAFRFPNSLRDLFADGALSAAFTKAMVDASIHGIEKEKELIAIVSGFFLTVTMLLAILGACFAEPFINVMSDPRFQASGGVTLASDLFRWLIFYLPLTMLNAVVMAILGIKGLTFRAMNGSLFLSIGMVAGALCWAPFLREPIYGLVWGALIGAFMQLIYQSMPLFQTGLLSFPRFNCKTWLRYKPLHEVLIMMTPRALGQGASTLALMINTYFALSVGSGAMTFVVTTMIIIQVPIGLFGVATGFASLPVLTQAINKHEFTHFSRLLTHSLNTSQWLAAATSIGFALLMVPFYILLFQHGKINFNDTIQNCLCIAAFSSGIIFAAGSKVLLNTLYALNATRQVVLNSIVYLIVSAVLSMLLVPAYGLMGLGFAFGIASASNYWLNYLLIYLAYQKFHPKHSPYHSAGAFYGVKNAVYSVVAFASSYLGIYLVTHFWQPFTQLTEIPLSMLNAGLVLCIGGLVYVAFFVLATYFLGPEQLKRMLRIKRYSK